jgi:signal transduction histidine kinase
VDQPNVLIISEDVELPRAITARWQLEPVHPAFTFMGADLPQKLEGDSFEMAVIAPLPVHILDIVLRRCEGISKPVVWLCRDNESLQRVRRQPQFIILQQQEGWLDTLVLLGSEVLRRCEARARAEELERANAVLEHHAALGRYVLEMRHTLNNALTSVLGNSELLLLEPATLSAEARAQVETIRNMGLRMHEILQRFTSIDKEMNAMETLLRKMSVQKSHVSAAGL